MKNETLSSVKKMLPRIIVGIVLLTILLYNSDLYRMKEIISKISLSILSFCLVAYLLSLIINSLRWQAFLPTYHWKRLFYLGMIAQTYSLIICGQLTGEAVKAYRLGKGNPQAEVIAASVVADKIVGVTAVLVLGVVAVLFENTKIPQVLRLGLFGVFGTVLIMLWVASSTASRNIINKTTKFISAKFPNIEGICARINTFTCASVDFFSRTDVFIKALLLGLIGQLIYVFVMQTIAVSIQIDISFYDWLWIHAVVSLATVLPLSVAGIGVREGAFVGVLGFLQIPMESALVLSFTIFFLQICMGLIGGLLEVKGV